MSSAQVQRKLEFRVKKTVRSQKNAAPIQEKSTSTKSSRSTRRSMRKQTVDQENIPSSETILTSPRKRNGQEDTENEPLQSSPSPSKKKKENRPTPRRRDETPIRSSLAIKFAAAKVSDENIEKKDIHDGSNPPVLSIRRQFEGSPLKSSPIKSCPSKVKTNTPSKTLFSKSCKEENSPKRSPVMRIGRPECAAYHQAKQSFHTAKPERLVGRDKEMAEIKGFLKGHMTKKTAGSLYISGAPGTGKTAVLTHIIDELKSVHSCKTVYLNCMTLDNSATVYGKLYSDITGKNAPTAKERQRAVERTLTSEGPSIIMVLDEIDQLDSKNQEILYTIFELPSIPKSRLILVGIANALDLTDRVLPRLQARPKCKPELLNFAPYSKEQISAILKDRIKDLEVDGVSCVDATAIQFCARKISAVAGDMRKALDVCRRAVELVETDVRSQRVLKSTDSASNSPVKQAPPVLKKISVVHINNVLSDVYGSSTTSQQQESIPLQQKLAVCSLLLLVKQGKMKEVTVGKLHDVYCKVCKNRQMAAVDQSEFHGITTLLESRGILGIKKAKETRMFKVTLKLDERELEHTMQDKVLISSILKDGLPK